MNVQIIKIEIWNGDVSFPFSLLMGVSSLNFFIALGDNGWKKVTSYSLPGIAWFKLNADSVVTLESPQGVSHTSLWPGSVMAFDTKWMTSDSQVKTKNIKEENTIVRICWSICNFYLCIGKKIPPPLKPYQGDCIFLHLKFILILLPPSWECFPSVPSISTLPALPFS